MIYHAKAIIDYSDKAVQEARLLAAEVDTTFCVGTSILNPCKPFMDLWYQVCHRLPGFKLHIVPFEDDHQGILGEISALGEKFDFLIGACDSPPVAGPVQFPSPGGLSPLCGRPPGSTPGLERKADHRGPLRPDPDDGQAGGFQLRGPGANLCGGPPGHHH